MKRQSTYDKEESRRYILEKRRQMIARRTLDKIRECENELALLWRELDKLFGMDLEERMLSTEELLGMPHISAYGDFRRETEDEIRSRINKRRGEAPQKDRRHGRGELQSQIESRMESLRIREELDKYKNTGPNRGPDGESSGFVSDDANDSPSEDDVPLPELVHKPSKKQSSRSVVVPAD